MQQELLRNRLLDIINAEGVNQKHIARKSGINESLLSRFKNKKCDLDFLDEESLDKFLTSKGY